MKWSISIGSIAGIRIELHVTFVLFLAWVAIAEGAAAADPARAVAMVLRLLLIFACVLLHELGHALTARRYGIRTRDIILLPIGGVARLQRMPDKPAQEMVVAIAGPMVNVVIAALLWALRGPSSIPLPQALVKGALLESLVAVNVLMVAFNLIPAFPMDGGRVLRAALAFKLPYLKATRIASGIGQAIALLFGVIGFFYNPMLMFVALFVFLAAGEEYALVQTRSSLSGLPARAAMITEFEVLAPGDPLRRAVDALMAGSQQDFPVLENGEPVGILSRADLLRAIQAHGMDTTVGEVITRSGEMADATEPLEAVIQRMRERRLGALPVVSGGQLVGLLTFENVTELLLVKDAIKRSTGAA